ncbi:unnamed protein product [Cuscuta epithymum]|uniref:Uncharacterized protein n=1 Tax=Cuscuta epithymum TaxID=186058 RepID=A0AAV0CWT6_9ASTE|nr:unnamed protein product [Cuscuta epithymum]
MKYSLNDGPFFIKVLLMRHGINKSLTNLLVLAIAKVWRKEHDGLVKMMVL